MIKINNNHSEKVEKMYTLLQECEAKGTTEREKSIKLLQDSFSLYKEIIAIKGTRYCSKQLPDVPRRMNNLVTNLMEYDS
jgi:hypothetical protein